MIEFGKTLREAREAKGLSISQVAEATRIMRSIVEGLENENFSGIPAPIYGRGFVKLYCETVGLDPKPMVAEFMEIYNGNRDVGIKERHRQPEPAPAERPIDTVASEPTMEPEPEPEPEPPPEPEPVFAPAPPEPDLFSMPVQKPAMPSERPAQNISRYATPVRQRTEYGSLPPTLGRWAALGLGALVVVVLVVLGLRALYRATSPAPDTVEDATQKAAAAVVASEKREASTPTPQHRDDKPRKERVPQDIPSLYID